MTCHNMTSARALLVALKSPGAFRMLALLTCTSCLSVGTLQMHVAVGEAGAPTHRVDSTPTECTLGWLSWDPEVHSSMKELHITVYCSQQAKCTRT